MCVYHSSTSILFSCCIHMHTIHVFMFMYMYRFVVCDLSSSHLVQDFQQRVGSLKHGVYSDVMYDIV